MRQGMKKLLVLVFIAAAAYGQASINDTVLVYKVSGSLNPWVDYNAPCRNTADWVDKVPLTAYLIVEVNDANGMVLDDGDALLLVVYGKNGKYLFGESFPDKWCWVHDTVISSEHLATNIFNITPDANGIFCNGDLGIDGFSASVYGKNVKNIAISATAKVALAKTLKGNIDCNDAADLMGGSGYNNALGSVTLTFDPADTKDANELLTNQVDGILSKIKLALISKGYQNITPTSP